ncbi:MAG: hypothetical protein QXV42_01210 [Ignisphaera sp.]
MFMVMLYTLNTMVYHIHKTIPIYICIPSIILYLILPNIYLAKTTKIRYSRAPLPIILLFFSTSYIIKSSPAVKTHNLGIRGTENMSITQQSIYNLHLIPIAIILYILLLALLIIIVIEFKNKHHIKNRESKSLDIFDLIEKPIPSLFRYRDYLILLLKRLTTEYIIEIEDMNIYKQTINYLREIRELSEKDHEGEKDVY